MDYFVSIENTPYFYWQSELLIESFKKLNLDGHLTIAIAENDLFNPEEFPPNLFNHQKKFLHPNVGLQCGYPPLNRTFGFITAISNKLLDFPFGILHSDMVLFEPLVSADWDIGFNPEPVPSSVLANTLPYVYNSLKTTQIPELPLGSVMIFNRMPEGLPERIYKYILQLKAYRGTDWDVEKGAWLLALYENLNELMYGGENYTCTMTDQSLYGNLIHYRHGTTPHFHKAQYHSYSNISLNAPNPYQLILEQTPVPPTKFIQDLIRGYFDRTK